MDQPRCGADTPDGPCALPPHRRGWHDADPPVIRVPRNRDGHVQVSISQIRRYGAAFEVDDLHEDVHGCPRAYALTYGADPVPEPVNRARELGSVLHRALHRMDTHTCGPEDALQAVWPATLGMGDYADAVEILLSYLDRSGPMTLYATLDTELDLAVPLYADEDYGPVYFRGIIDNLAVDPQQPDVVHNIDHKSASRPVAASALRGDVQLRGYDWLVRQWWALEHGEPPARVISHLDLLRYSDIQIEYTPYELDIWHGWAVAMVRTMLRDRAAMPILNDGCGGCAVRWGCPAWRGLPGTAESMLARLTGQPVDKLKDQYLDVAQVYTLLGKQRTQLKETLEAEARATGRLLVADQVWAPEPDTKTEVDILGLMDLLLPAHPAAFLAAVSSSKAAVERAVRGLEPSLRVQVLGCVSSVESGTKVTKRKAQGER